MGMTAAQRRTLSRRAADNSIEVEHLLEVAAVGDAVDAPFVRALKIEHGWSNTACVGSSRIVPFGRWADTVCRFLEDGYTGLVAMSVEAAGSAKFCIGLVEEIRTPESVFAVLAIGRTVIERPAIDVQLALRIANAFNLLLSLKDVPTVAPSVEHEIRDFLHRLLEIELSEEQRASAVCALRGVGDESSAARIAALPPFQGNWAGLEASAARQIKKRLRWIDHGRI
jgi:hypothetical protein